jgi:hypothetical protein
MGWYAPSRPRTVRVQAEHRCIYSASWSEMTPPTSCAKWFALSLAVSIPKDWFQQRGIGGDLRH